MGAAEGGACYGSEGRGMIPPPEEDGSAPVYALRFSRRALADIDAAHARFVELAEQSVADEWKDGLFDAIARLATVPGRALIPEAARFRQEVRQIIYRRPGSRVAYRVLFTVQLSGPDGPVVSIVTVRHGAARPITRAEAKEIEADK